MNTATQGVRRRSARGSAAADVPPAPDAPRCAFRVRIDDGLTRQCVRDKWHKGGHHVLIPVKAWDSHGVWVRTDATVSWVTP